MFRHRRYPENGASFVASESAATAVEYALLLGCVVVLAMVVVMSFGDNTQRAFRHMAQSIEGEPGPVSDQLSDGPAATSGAAPATAANQAPIAGHPRPLLLGLLVAVSTFVLIVASRYVLQCRRSTKTARGESHDDPARVEQRIYDRRQRILRQLGNNTERLFQAQLKVSDLMSEDIAVVLPTTKRSDVVTRMRQSGVGHAYVCAGDGRLLGIVRRRQLVRASGGEAAHFLDSNVPSINADTPVSQAVTTILNEHQSGLAVVDGGTLLGEVTMTDLAIALQCFLQILLRMGQLVDSAVPADDETLNRVADLHMTQQAQLNALSDQVQRMKDSDAQGKWKQIQDQADLLIESNHRLLKGVQQTVGQLDQRMRNLVTLFDTRTDELTGVGNARALDEALANQCALRKRYDQPLSLLLLRFEAPTVPGMGADPGEYDQRVRSWAMWLQERVRETDVVSRYEDQVFAVVLAHTDQDAARHLRNRLHKSLFAKGLGSATVVIVSAEDGDTAREMISRGSRMLGLDDGTPNQDDEYACPAAQ